MPQERVAAKPRKLFSPAESEALRNTNALLSLAQAKKELERGNASRVAEVSRLSPESSARLVEQLRLRAESRGFSGRLPEEQAAGFRQLLAARKAGLNVRELQVSSNPKNIALLNAVNRAALSGKLRKTA